MDIPRSSTFDAMIAPRFRSSAKSAIPLNTIQRNSRKKILYGLREETLEIINAVCPFCTSKLRIVVSEIDTYGIPGEHAVCEECGCFYASRHLSSDSLTAIYDSLYRDLDRGDQKGQAGLFRLEEDKGRKILRYLNEHNFDNHPGSLVVDVGCGAGGTLNIFREIGMNVFGIDIGSEYIAYGQKKNLAIVDCSIEDLGLHLESGSVDLFIVDQVLEHIQSPASLLKTLRSFMKTDGKIYISVPGFRNIGSHYMFDIKRYLQFVHLLHFDACMLERFLIAEGFKVEMIDESVVAVASINDSLRKPRMATCPSYSDVIDFLNETEKLRAKMKNRIASFLLIKVVWTLGALRADMKRLFARV
ncbi:unannotated protein [freshwater metagenome]|uniref:Unannotated protein n=1 Tax=freshwater metagenome TaxID=449393 RepID=A0A6J6ZWF4_9ZZZZ